MELPSKKYSIIYADPPWSYRDKCNAGQRGASHKYQTMNLAWIKVLPVGMVADKDCALFMWATMPLLPEAIETMKAWGFDYRTVAFTWIKQNKVTPSLFWGMGNWSRCMTGDTEIYLYDKQEKKVLNSTLKNLNNIDRYLIWTNNGWKQILNKIETDKKMFHTFKTKFSTLNISPEHRLLFKRPISSKGKSRSVLEFGTTEDYKRWKNLAAVTKQGYSVDLVFSKRPIESLNPEIYHNEFELNYDMGWLLGLFLAEGNYCNGSAKNQIRFSLHAKETDIFENIKRIVCALNLSQDRYFNYKVTPRRFVKDNKMSVYFASSKIKCFLESFIFGKGSHNKRINIEKILQTQTAFRQGIFDGMMRGDGHFLNKSQWKLALCNKGLIKDMSDLCFSIGIQNKISEQKPQYKGKTLCYKYKLICLNRNEFNYKDRNVESVHIESFYENVGSETLYDITVDGGEFIANNIISHNSNTELCLLGVKGKPKRIDKGVHSVIQSPIEAHSKKPDETRERIVRLMGDVPRIELFARQHTPGWDVWGNEV